MLTKRALAITIMAAIDASGLAAAQAIADQSGAPQPASAPRPQAAIVQASPKSYAQELVDTTAARHRELLQLDIHATPPGGSVSIVVASRNPARIGRRSDADDVRVVETGTPFVEINRSGDQNVEVHVPLLDVNARIIGEVEVTFPYPAGSGFDENGLIQVGKTIRDEMSRRIHDLPSLLDAVQLDPHVPIDTYAQSLVDEILARYPEVEVLTIHAAAPGVDSPYPIVASNIGRIGKPADESDLEVIRTGKPHVQADTKGGRVEAKLPLQDASGNVVGAIAVVFPLRPEQKEAALYRQAEELRDDLRSRIANSAQLFQARSPAPAPAATVETSQQINQEELANQQSLPMTKQVASGAALRNAEEGYSEAVKNQAGVAPSSSKGSPSDTISIRGINVNPISNYRLNGGLPIAGITTVPTEDKERLETLKGANALMFGIASPAGILNLVTKRAENRDIASVSMTGTSFGQYYNAVDLGQRYGDEKQLGARLNVSTAHLENGVRGTDGHGNFQSLALDWRASDRLSFQGDVEHYRKQTILQATVGILAPVNGIVPVPSVPDPRNLLSGPWATFEGETTNVQGRGDFVIADGWKVLGEVGQSDSDRGRYVTRITKYNPITGAGGVVTAAYSDQNLVNKFDRSELLGDFHTGWLKHNLTLGVSSSERDTFTPLQNSITLKQKQNIFDPIALPGPAATGFTSLAPQISKDTGLYTYDTVGVIPAAKVLLGFRRTRSTLESGSTQSTADVNSPAYGFLYDVLPTTTLFASYMKGLEDGAVAPANAANANTITPPAVSTQKEIGIRDSYFRGLSTTASYFDITRENAVLDPVTNVFSNNGTIRYRGAEAVVAYEINRMWAVNTAGQWLHTIQNSVDTRINGLTPENTPRLIGNVFITHRSPLLAGLTLTAGTSYVTKRFVNPQDQGTIPGYFLYSANIGYTTRIASHPASIQLSADNLANTRYWNSSQQGTYGIGMDRSVKLNAKFAY